MKKSLLYNHEDLNSDSQPSVKVRGGVYTCSPGAELGWGGMHRQAAHLAFWAAVYMTDALHVQEEALP